MHIICNLSVDSIRKINKYLILLSNCALYYYIIDVLRFNHDLMWIFQTQYS